MSNFVPPVAVRNAAKRGIDLVNKGKSGSGFELATAERARKIAAGKPLTLDHIKRMHSFFARHSVDRKPGWDTAGKETPGYTAHMAWGGNAGANWSARIAQKNQKV
jgi:hypothetical protein